MLPGDVVTVGYHSWGVVEKMPFLVAAGGGDDCDNGVGRRVVVSTLPAGAQSPLAPRNEREPSGKSIVPCTRLGNDE